MGKCTPGIIVRQVIKMTAVRMDLHSEEAQDLLNKAVEMKGRLYAKKNGCYYVFQNERDIDYHGYRADDVGDDMKSQLDKVFA